jgi:hypothetical protein
MGNIAQSEAELYWHSESDPFKLLGKIRAEQYIRKYLLYLVAGCRCISHLFYDPTSFEIIEILQRKADAMADPGECMKACAFAESLSFGYDFENYYLNTVPQEQARLVPLVVMGALSESPITNDLNVADEGLCKRLVAASKILFYAASLPDVDSGHLGRIAHSAASLGGEWPGRWLVDCIFGNPYNATNISFGLSSVPYKIASNMYDNNCFHLCGELANALLDAGFCDEAVIRHMRSEMHFRGCWVVDAILGRK